MNIIVTGASSGIGYETVKIFSKDSTHNIIAIARSEDKLKSLRSDCLSYNKDAQVHLFPCDLSDAGFIISLLPYIKKKFTSLDILINNAGLLINKPIEKISDNEMRKVFETNFFSTVTLIQELLPLLSKGNQNEQIAKKSHIINIGSMGGYQGSDKFPGLSIYSSSKAALANLSECLAVELQEKNIAVNCLALGAVQTEMLSVAFPDFQAPLSASEMAEFIAEFSIRGHQYFNGKVIPVSLAAI